MANKETKSKYKKKPKRIQNATRLNQEKLEGETEEDRSTYTHKIHIIIGLNNESKLN